VGIHSLSPSSIACSLSLSFGVCPGLTFVLQTGLYDVLPRICYLQTLSPLNRVPTCSTPGRPFTRTYGHRTCMHCTFGYAFRCNPITRLVESGGMRDGRTDVSEASMTIEFSGCESYVYERVARDMSGMPLPIWWSNGAAVFGYKMGGGRGREGCKIPFHPSNLLPYTHRLFGSEQESELREREESESEWFRSRTTSQKHVY